MEPFLPLLGWTILLLKCGIKTILVRYYFGLILFLLFFLLFNWNLILPLYSAVSFQKHGAFGSVLSHLHGQFDKICFRISRPSCVSCFCWMEKDIEIHAAVCLFITWFFPPINKLLLNHRGSVANMLVTSCEDSICRVWVETVLPEDGLVNMNNFDPLAAQNPRFRTHRHKHKFLQRLKHMR